MGYIDKNLLPDERILYRTKKNKIIFLTPAFLTGICCLFLFNSNPFVVKITFIPAIAALFSWMYEWLDYFTSEYAITTKRILMKEGFFFRHANDTRISTIANVSVNQSLLGQALDYGTVIINTYGGSADPFTEIDQPIKFQRVLQEQVDKVTR